MIIISEVAQKLEKILNGLDLQTSDKQNPTPFFFHVETEGFHIDHLEEPNGARNFIPVFISSMGGQYNPVKGLKQGSYVIPIVFYYPVRFKNDFFALGEMLVDVFVGEILEYGPISGKAISNISVPTYGEIQNLDFAKFQNWLSDHNFPKRIEEMEPYMSMQITLYLSNSAPGFIYGNDVKVSLSFTHDSKTYSIDDVKWDGASIQSNSQTQSEQDEDASVPESDSLPFGTGYGSSFKVYPNLEDRSKESVAYTVESGTYDPNATYYRLSDGQYVYIGKLEQEQYNLYHQGGVTLYVGGQPYYFYRELLKVWLEGKIQDVTCTITYTFGDPSYGIAYSRTCFIQSIVAPIEKGQLISLTINFAKLAQDEEEEE